MDDQTFSQNPDKEPAANEESLGGAFQAADELIRELREAAGADVSSGHPPHAPSLPESGLTRATPSAFETPAVKAPEKTGGAPDGASLDVKMPTGPTTVHTAEFDAPNRPQAAKSSASGIELLMDVNLPVSIELGRTQLSISEILELGKGSIVELDKLAGEPVDIRVNNITLAKGEVVVLDEHFGVRITSLASRRDRLSGLGA